MHTRISLARNLFAALPVLLVATSGAAQEGFATFTESDFGPEGVKVPDRNRPVQTDPDADPADAPSADKLSFSLSADITNTYFFRGIFQTADDFVFQPGAELGFDIVETDAVSYSGFAGVWSSFQDSNGATGDGIAANHYELDLYAGLAAQIDRLALAAVYTAYTSPNDSFAQIDEIRLDATYDDTDLFAEGFALNPSATLAFELDGTAAGSDEGVFLGFRVAPAVFESETPAGNLTIEIPAEIGLSLDNYYQDASGDSDFFGYFDIGVDAALDLPEPEGYGDWSFAAGLHALFLGEAAGSINAGTEAELIFSVGASIAF